MWLGDLLSCRILRMEGGADPFEVLPWVQTSEDTDDSSSDTSMV